MAQELFGKAYQEDTSNAANTDSGLFGQPFQSVVEAAPARQTPPDLVGMTLPSDPLPVRTPSQAPTGTPSVVNYAMEGVSAANRAALQLADIATSPLQLVLNMGLEATGREGLPTLRQATSSTIGEKGSFAGEGLMTDIMATTGEMGVGGVGYGIGTRFIARTFDDLVGTVGTGSFSQTLNNVLQTIGRTGSGQDLAYGALSGAGIEMGGEAAARIFGEEHRLAGEFAGGFALPAISSAALSVLQNTGRQLLRQSGQTFRDRAAPSIDRIYGASKAMYAYLDQAGVAASRPSAARLQSSISRFMNDRNIDPATGAGIVNTRLNQLLKAADEGKVSFGFLDEVHSEFGKIAARQKGTDQGELARDAAEVIDDFILNMQVNNSDKLLGEGMTVGAIVKDARSLWRRYKQVKTMDNIVDDAALDAAGKGKDYVQVLRGKLTNILKKDNKLYNQFDDDQRALIKKAVEGGRFENFLNLGKAIGFSSNDLVRNILIGGAVGGAYAAGNSAVGKTILGVTALGGAMQKGANLLFKNNVQLMRGVMRGGGNAEAIVQSYLKHTPIRDRNARDLSILLMTNTRNPSSLINTQLHKMPLISDALALTIAGNRLIDAERRELNLPPLGHNLNDTVER